MTFSTLKVDGIGSGEGLLFLDLRLMIREQ